MVCICSIKALDTVYHEHTVGDNRLVVQRLPLEGKLVAMPCLRKRPATPTDEVEKGSFLARKSIGMKLSTSSVPLRGTPSPQGEGFQGASPSTLPLYHARTFFRYIPVVHRLPLEGKLAAVPCLRKRPAATTDEVEKRGFPIPNGDYIAAFHLIPPLRGDLPLKGKAFKVLLHLHFHHILSVGPAPQGLNGR